MANLQPPPIWKLQTHPTVPGTHILLLLLFLLLLLPGPPFFNPMIEAKRTIEYDFWDRKVDPVKHTYNETKIRVLEHRHHSYIHTRTQSEG